jgi:hypothetical protein
MRQDEQPLALSSERSEPNQIRRQRRRERRGLWNRVLKVHSTADKGEEGLPERLQDLRVHVSADLFTRVPDISLAGQQGVHCTLARRYKSA